MCIYQAACRDSGRIRSREQMNNTLGFPTCQLPTRPRECLHYSSFFSGTMLSCISSNSSLKRFTAFIRFNAIAANGCSLPLLLLFITEMVRSAQQATRPCWTDAAQAVASRSAADGPYYMLMSCLNSLWSCICPVLRLVCLHVTAVRQVTDDSCKSLYR